MIKQNIENILTAVQQNNSKLKSANTTLIAVSKKRTKTEIIEAIDAGITNFGENYLTEAEDKWLELKADYPNITLHFIGHLQSNKLKKIHHLFDVIHSIDSSKLINDLKNYQDKPKKYLLQLDLDPENSNKAGLQPKDLEATLQYATECKVPISGLMGMCPINCPVSPYFAFLYQLKNKYSLNELSMGMTHDYVEAVTFGSTMLRIGSGIFN